MEKFISITLGIVALLFGGILSSFLYAKVLQDLWRWFMVPQFGLQPIGFWEAAGLSLVAGFFLSQVAKTKTDFDEGTGPLTRGITVLLANLLLVLALWGFGAIYANFL